MTTMHLTMEEVNAILEQNPEPKDVSFLQMQIQEKSSDDWRSFLSFYSKETDVIYRLRGYGSTPGQAADDAWKTFNDEELRWIEIDSYERHEEPKSTDLAPFRNFDGMCWPAPCERLDVLEHGLRYEPRDSSFSMPDRLLAASVINAYKELIRSRSDRRNTICQELSKGPGRP